MPFDELSERDNIVFKARAFERCKIGATLMDRDSRPRVATRCEQGVHHKTSDSPVAVGVGVDVAEQPVTKNRAHARLILVVEQLEKGRYGIR